MISSWHHTVHDISFYTPKEEEKMRQCEFYDIRLNNIDTNVFGSEPQHFDQRAYVDLITKIFGKFFVDLTENLRNQGLFTAWEKAESRLIDQWGAKIVWVPIANSSGGAYLNSNQVKELGEIMSSYKNTFSSYSNGWKWRVKENLKPSSEYGQGHRMCLFLNRESHISLENHKPWHED